MSERIRPIAEWAAAIVEVVGIGVIVAVVVWTLVYAGYRLIGGGGEDLIKNLRRRLAHGILLGLEFLVAADIIHTVAVDLTFETVGVLAIVVLIRTFLSFAMEVELSGRWPWQGAGDGTES